MKYTFLFLIVFTQNIATCQTLKKLDQQNGFNKFKFGMLTSQFQNQLKETTDSSPLKQVKYYHYIGEDSLFLYGVKIETIELAFVNNKLYMIGVHFGSLTRAYTAKEQNQILDGLKSSFGTDSHNCSNAKKADWNILNCTIWDGERVRLEHVRTDFSTPNNKDANSNNVLGYLLFSDKKAKAALKPTKLKN